MDKEVLLSPRDPGFNFSNDFLYPIRQIRKAEMREHIEYNRFLIDVFTPVALVVPWVFTSKDC